MQMRIILIKHVKLNILMENGFVCRMKQHGGNNRLKPRVRYVL